MHLLIHKLHSQFNNSNSNNYKILQNYMGQEQSKKHFQSQFSPQNNYQKNPYKYEIPLESFKEFQYEKNHMISSITANSKLTVFQKTQQIPKNIGNLIAINTQLIYRQKKNTDIEAIEKILKYYEIRKKLNQDQEIDDNIIKLFSFEAQNSKSKQKIYPEIKTKSQKSLKSDSNKQNRLGSMCSFELFNSRASLEKTKSIIDRKGCYEFKFVYEFYLNNLQKQIQLRAQNNSFFLQKQIWSLLWCCISVASKMVNLGLKQPMLSPACIFISQQSLIKVGQWEFSSYYVHNKTNQFEYQQQEGQTILNLNLQQQQIQCDSNENKNILMKYYWAPEGLIQMQKVISLGQILKVVRQKSQKKNSQIFSLGMSVIQMCTLSRNYQKSTYSEKQLTKIINKTIQDRQKSGESLSEEMITFIKKMLAWDCQDRITYEQALQYIQTYFSEHNSIFQEQNLGNSQTQRNPNTNKNVNQPQFQSMFTEQSIINLNMNNQQQKIMIRQENQQNIDDYFYEQKQSIGTTHLNLNGSGLVNQGEGDTFLPQQNEQNDVLKNNNNFIYLQSMLPLAPDFADFQNFNDIGLQQTFQNYKYDEDEFQHLRNSKQEIEFEINEPNQQFKIDQGRRSVKDIQNRKRQQTQQKNDTVLVLVQNKSLRNIKNYYSQLQQIQNFDSLKLNVWNQKIKQETNNNSNYESRKNNNQTKNQYEYYSNSFENTFNNKKTQNDFCLITQNNQVKNNFKIKMTYSPSVESQEYSSIPSNKQSIFTDPALMAMIKQYSSRKQINQQPKTTPKQTFNQQTFILTNNYHNKNYAQVTSTSNSLSIQPFQQKKSSRSSKNQINFVKEQFSRGFYQGSKKSGMRNGYGTFYYNEGGKYSGYWLDNQMEGHGTLYYPDGRVAYEGQWHSDSLHGKGVLHNERPIQIKYEYDYSSFNECQSQQCWVYYDGWFQKDQKCGFGQLLLSNGEKYVGQFQNDMIHGKGKFYVLSGQIVQGYWQNNELVQIINENSD